MSKHIKNKILIDFCDGTLSDKAHKNVLRHIEDCAECSDKLRLIRGLEQAAGQKMRSNPDVMPVIREKLKKQKAAPTINFRQTIFRYRKIAYGSVLALALILVIAAVWRPVSGVVSGVLENRFRNSRAAGPETSAPSEPASNHSGQAADRKDTFRFGLYRSTMTYQEVIALSGIKPEENQRINPYAKVPIDKIITEEEPFLTDNDIASLNPNTMVLTLKDGVYDRISKSLASALIQPFVAEIDGNRIYWGVFLSPLSSMMPPNSIPRFDFSIGEEPPYLRLSNMEEILSTDDNALLKLFDEQKKLDLFQDPQNEIRKQGPGSETSDSMTIIDFNSSKLRTVTLKLPRGWSAAEQDYEISKNFSFKVEKNNSAGIVQSFTLYFPDQLKNTFYWGSKGEISGELVLQGYYKDEPNGAVLPNHSQVDKIAYEGNSALGKTKVYLLDCDLPQEAITVTDKTFMMFFAVIPIEGEDLAYTLSIPVPSGYYPDTYFPYVKEILGLD